MNFFPQIAALQRLLKRLHVQPRYIALSAVLSLLAAVFEGISLALLAPLLQGIITNDFDFVGTHQWLQYLRYFVPTNWFNDRGLFLLLFLGVFFGTLLKIVFRFLSGTFVAYLAYTVADTLRRQIFSRYLQFGKLYFDRTSSGYLTQLLMDYTARVTRPIMEANQFFNAISSFVIYLLLMCLISWQLTLIVILVFPIMNAAQKILTKRIRRKSQDLTAAINAFSKATFNILTSIPLVLAYSQQSAEEHRFAQHSSKASDQEYRLARLHDLIRPTHELIATTTLVILVIATLGLTARGHLQLSASFLVYFYLLMNVTNTYGLFQRYRGLIAQVSGPLAEMQKVFVDSDKHFVPDGLVTFPGLHKAIRFNALHFKYPDGRQALHKLSTTIKKGQMTAIVGPSGAGKTTLINLLLRFYDTNPGQLLIDDVDIRNFTLETLRSHMALVSQDTALFNDTLRNNITYGLPTVADNKLADVLRKARLANFISELPQGVETEIGDRGVKLSGGEKQRVSIARALLKGAEIIILDEATSALDSKTEQLIQEAIDEAIQGKTAIVIAHRLSTIQHADSIIVIENGTVVEQGTLPELLSHKGPFFAYWEAQKFT